MNRRQLFVLSLSLVLVVVLSACAVQKPGSLTTLPTGDARTLNVSPSAAALSDATSSDRQTMAQYQDTITFVTTLDAKNAIILHPLNNQQAMARYLDTITLVTILDAKNAIVAD